MSCSIFILVQLYDDLYIIVHVCQMYCISNFLYDVFLHTLYSCTLHSIADASVYPASIGLHNVTVNMIANLWHCPKPPNGDKIMLEAELLAQRRHACWLVCILSSMMFFDKQIF